MKYSKWLYIIGLIVSFDLVGQKAKSDLTIDKIMQDPKMWMGTAPSNAVWSEDNTTVYFNWNPNKNKADSLYKFSISVTKPTKVEAAERLQLPSNTAVYSKDFSKKVFEKNGDLFLYDCQNQSTKQLTNTAERESNPYFDSMEERVIFTRSQNLYSMHLITGLLTQHTQFLTGVKKSEPKLTEQEEWLKNDQLDLFEILEERKIVKDLTEANNKKEMPKRSKEIYLDTKVLENSKLSPDLDYVYYRLKTNAKADKAAVVPNYVTQSGFTENLNTREKVGYEQPSYQYFIYQIKKDTVLELSVKDLPGIMDKPSYYKDYEKLDTAKAKLRKVSLSEPIWSADGKNAVASIRAFDNKDRWIVKIDLQSAKLTSLARMHDDAWIGGPGIGFNFSNGTLGWLNNDEIYYQSEESGYSHIYVLNINTLTKKQVTNGKYEVLTVQLSKDKKFFYITTNEVHPGEQHFYKLSVDGSQKTRLTFAKGAHQVSLSPNEQWFIDRFSTSNKPWEFYLVNTEKPTETKQITQSTFPEFNSYSWRMPEIVNIKAKDGATIYARLYKPIAGVKNKKAVIFVHGAGYLQNVHYWWSQYFREYMFHNMLADQGYTVLDIDYRASAGYGRDWRTGIYRHMGGKDLEDHVDAAKYLVEKQGVNAKKIGIYGGSYGGFITLMALFTKPGIFAAGAALRPVTDWAAYNQGYTANILNTPALDSLAYRKSSPIYFANGLQDKLLICHGMVDVNVHYQDAVRLAQRLIELKKENWELASYPMEDHGFVEETSWADEYKRILKLFDGM